VVGQVQDSGDSCQRGHAGESSSSSSRSRARSEIGSRDSSTGCSARYSPHPVTARLVVRRVRDRARLDELFPV
jgi:hypothetical protein